MASDEACRGEAIARVRAYVGKPLFGEAACATGHRGGLRAAYEEAARVEFGLSTYEEDAGNINGLHKKTLSPPRGGGDKSELLLEEDKESSRRVELTRRIAWSVQFEAECVAFSKEVETALKKLNTITKCRVAARAKSNEVAEACDAALAAQRELVLEAERYDDMLRDYEPLPASLDALVDQEDEDDFDPSAHRAIRVMEDLYTDADARESRIRDEGAMFADADTFLEELSAHKNAILVKTKELCVDALVKAVLRGTDDVRAVAGAVRQGHALLRRAEAQSGSSSFSEAILERGTTTREQSLLGDAVVRKYCKERGDLVSRPEAAIAAREAFDRVMAGEDDDDQDVVTSTAVKLREAYVSAARDVDKIACRPERVLFSSLFGENDRDSNFLDGALFEACAYALHEATMRPVILRTNDLNDLRGIVDASKFVADSSDEGDDAVREASRRVMRDAQERAMFVASSKIREEVEDYDFSGIDASKPPQSTQVFFPPVRSALLVLSQLHGSVDAPIFDDFAQHALQAAKHAVLLAAYPPRLRNDTFLSSGVPTPDGDAPSQFVVPEDAREAKKRAANKTTLRDAAADFTSHGGDDPFASSQRNKDDASSSNTNEKNRDLFAVRHLLALREKVAPFGITRGPAIRRRLNWTAARGALADFNEKHARRRRKEMQARRQNASTFAKLRARLASFVRDGGLPRVTTVQSPDARKDLERDVKAACARYVDALHDDLVGPLAYVVNLAAMRCPGVDAVQADNVSPAQLTDIKGLAFAQFDAMKDALRETRIRAVQVLDSVDAHLALYLDNPNTRKVLVKPAKDRAAKTLADYRALTLALFSGDADRLDELKPHFDFLAHAFNPVAVHNLGVASSSSSSSNSEHKS